ncbi:MAG: hypothetical protein AAF429_09250 [Pseudomonadota bacterium]
MRIGILMMIVASLGTTGSASQPFSKSLAECATLYELFAVTPQAEARGEEFQFHLITVIDSYWAKADDWASREGVPNRKAYFDAIKAESYPRWDAQLGNPLKLQDTKDWIDYCRAFGKDQRLVLIY